MAPTVVILGAGFVGVLTAHKLLKYTTPKVKGLKVILVSETTHFYWNPASVRGIVPGELSDDQLFHPIASGFERFKKDEFELVVGTATSLQPETNSVHVRLENGSVAPITYDHLVVATGSSVQSPDVPFKNLGSYEKTKEQLHKVQAAIGAASTKSIVVAGGGATGVEVAGELGHRYGKTKEKTVTLVISGDRVLEGNTTSVSGVAESTLARLGVNIIRNARVVESRDNHVTLSTGKTIPADVYLPSHGVRPNTSFIPERYLDEKKNLKLRTTLQVDGLENVWGAGDVGNLDPKQIAALDPQINTVSANVDAALTGNSAGLKQHKPLTKEMIVITLGKEAGTGQLGGWKIPSFFTVMLKSKSFMVDKPPYLIGGKRMTASGSL